MPITVDNSELVRTLRELATQFASEGQTFSAQSFFGAARTIERLARPVAEIWCAGGLAALTALPWVGSRAALRIVECISAGGRSAAPSLRTKSR